LAVQLSDTLAAADVAVVDVAVATGVAAVSLPGVRHLSGFISRGMAIAILIIVSVIITRAGILFAVSAIVLVATIPFHSGSIPHHHLHAVPFHSRRQYKLNCNIIVPRRHRQRCNP